MQEDVRLTLSPFEQYILAEMLRWVLKGRMLELGTKGTACIKVFWQNIFICVGKRNAGTL